MSNLGTISAQQAGTFPALTQGSYVSQGCGAGPGILDFQVEWNGSGSFSLQVGDSISGNAWETYPVSSIIGTSNGVLVTGAPTASGIYRCAVDGGGASGQSPLTKLGAIIFATALSGGAVVTISSSFTPQLDASPGTPAGGEEVTFVPPNSTAFGRITIASSNAAQRGPNVPLKGGVALQAAPNDGTFTGNVATVWVKGDDTVSPSTGAALTTSGGGFAVACSNLNQVWFYGTAGDVIQYGAS